MAKGKKKYAGSNRRREEMVQASKQPPVLPPPQQQRGTGKAVTVSGVNLKSESRKRILMMLQKIDIIKNLSAAEGDDDDEDEDGSSVSNISRRQLLDQMVAVEKQELVNGKHVPGHKPVTSPLYIPDEKKKPGTKVRCSVCIPHLLREKKPLVIVSSLDLAELFAMAKNKIKQLKKPARAFLVVSENQRDPASSKYIEIFDTSSFKNEAVIAITNGTSFEEAVASKGKAVPKPPPKTDSNAQVKSDLDEESSDVVDEDAPEQLLERVRDAYAARKQNTVKQISKNATLKSERAAIQQPQVPGHVMAQRQRLPAFVHRKEIVDTIRENQVVVLSGETGCGKTTQVPQLVLDSIRESGEGDCHIICTQPRRLSAIGVATRVASERGQRVGEEVGYSVRVDRRISNRTCIHFCTVGILLRRLQSDPTLSGVTHVMIDEVHERGVQSDFALVILRELVTTRPELRVVLMSASINPVLFSEYFGGCPTLSIPGLAYPVETFYLEDAIEHSKYFVRDGERYSKFHKNGRVKQPRGNQTNLANWDLEFACSKHTSATEYQVPKISQFVQSTLDNLKSDEINFELIERLIMHCYEQGKADETRTGGKAILVFLPGMQDISNLQRQLSTGEVLKPRENFRILPLHSTLNSQDQQKIFVTPPEGVCKVVLSTNIAETSITIDDLGFVIDTCRVKENQFDALNNMPTLVETWISQASAQQRRGRAGRTGKGICYHLVQKKHHDLGFAAFTTPEMLRVSLEDIVLQIKLLELGAPEGCPYKFLAQAIEPPPIESVSRTIAWLKEINALTQRSISTNNTGTAQETPSSASGQHLNHYGGMEDTTILTPLGFNLALLPVDVRLGKMLIFSCVFKCLDPILSISSAISFKSPFVSGPPGKQEAANDAKLSFARTFHPTSDLLAIVAVYDRWQQVLAREGHGSRAEWKFAQDNFVSLPALRTMQQLRMDFARQLHTAGFLGERNARLNNDELRKLINQVSGNSEMVSLIRCVLVAGLYPHVAYVSVKSDTGGGSRLLCGYREECHIHPSSVNARVPPKALGSSLLAYHERLRTSKVFLRDTTPVSPSMVLLFGGELEIDHLNKTVRIGSWMQVKASTSTAVLFKFLRRALDEVLVNKVQGSIENNVEQENKDDLVIETVVTLLGGRRA